MIVQFKMDEAALKFQLQNLSQSNLTVDYSKASLAIDHQAHPVRFSRTLYHDTSANRSSVAIPPLAFVRDLLIPYDNVFNNGRKWIEVDLLPTTDNNSELMRKSILGRKGKTTVSVVLPVYFGTQAKTYTFDFQVSDVKKIPWREYVPSKRVPAPPEPKPHMLDQVTTAVLAVGVLGFTAFLVSVRKDPPTE